MTGPASLLARAYPALARPLLFRLGGTDAETAHHRTVAGLRRSARHPRLLRGLHRLFAADRAPRTVFGLDFPTPVGLAAGADKDGLALAGWPALGFGFVEAGTVTAVAQPGNPRPRVFRLPASDGVINRMGFPNAGAAALAARVRAAGPIGVPLGISLGKSKVVAVDGAIADYVTSLRAVHAVADYIAINVSSPNTPGLRGLQDRAALDALVAALVAETQALEPTRALPLLVKIAPDLTDTAIGEILQVCADRGVAGVIAANTTTARPHLAPADRGLALQAGGLSGVPLRARALDVVRFVCGHTDLPVIGVGGISSAADALAMLDAGASLVQLYTGLLYRGPALTGEITRAARERTEVRR